MFSAAKAGFSFGPPPSEDGCVWFLSSLESVGARRVVFVCVGVSEVAGGSVPSSLGCLRAVATASCSADACSLGTWQQEEQTMMADDWQPDLRSHICRHTSGTRNIL